MGRKYFSVLAAGLILSVFAAGQTPPEKKIQAPAVQPAQELADSLAQRLSNDLHVRTVVGEPIKVGSVTLIPILMIEIGFGGGGLAMPGGSATAAPANPAPGIDGFYMSGEARPLGFVAVTRNGTRFISIGKAPAK